MIPSSSIAERIREIKERIGSAANRSGRKPGDVLLLAVSKTVDAPQVREAYDAGLRDFGENRVQEALGKIPILPTDIRWHLIGSLQSNKINKVLGKFALIHSVDSYELAQGISDRMGKETQEVLLEVNTSGETTKAGMAEEETLENVKRIAQLRGIRLRGLMTVGPLTDDQKRQRESFRKLKGLFEAVKAQKTGGDSFSVLSMGMTSDFEMAVEEGSTLVRIGTAIFGPRVPQKD